MFFFSFRYLLNVSSITPSLGASTGGLRVIIKGFGFGSNRDQVNVTLGNSTCDVKRVNMTSVECVTEEHVMGTADLEVRLFVYRLHIYISDFRNDNFHHVELPFIENCLS